jgi:hypothetical protein
MPGAERLNPQPTLRALLRAFRLQHSGTYMPQRAEVRVVESETARSTASTGSLQR